MKIAVLMIIGLSSLTIVLVIRSILKKSVKSRMAIRELEDWELQLHE